MKSLTLCAVLVSIGLLSIIGCGDATDASATADSAVNIDGGKFLLHDEPEGAIGVITARESAEDGVPLVLVGRIGGTANPWIDGRAAFTLLDASITVVAEGEDSEDGEVCLGDCCATERLDCTTLVKVMDEQGRLVHVDSRKLLGLKVADMVVVEGTAKKDESGNFVMLAKGVYIRN